MVTAQEKLKELVEKIGQKLPDENDLKGFLGISKAMLLQVLEQASVQIEKLKEFDNHFETILLKRDLAEVFAKIKGNLKKEFAQINHGTFNSVLKDIARVRELVNRTYFTVVNEENIRSEAQLLQVQKDLEALTLEAEQLKKANQEVTEAKISVSEQISQWQNEIQVKKVTAETQIQQSADVVAGLRETTVSGIQSLHDQTKIVKDSADVILKGIQENEVTTTQVATRVEGLVTEIEGHGNRIQQIVKNVETWNADINKAQIEIDAGQKLVDSLAKQAKKLLDFSEDARAKLSGTTDANGKINPGLLQISEGLKKELEVFLKAQQEKYQAQFQEIEGLLPGATTVGLASAYEEQKNSYSLPLRRWSYIFVGTLTLMILFSAAVIYQQFTGSPITNLNQALTALLRYLPFYIPTIWLVSHASKQQSQARMLQQEYAFRETNAKSFHGHKEQIEKLIKEGATDKELLTQLLSQMVVITGQNPSKTLANQVHNDSHPFMKLIENITKRKKAEAAEAKEE